MLLLLLMMLNVQPGTILEASFSGSDRELAQGAIERHDLRHREVEPRRWLIEVDEGSPEDWTRRLNSSLSGGDGRFRVIEAQPEEIEKVRKGEITLQR